MLGIGRRLSTFSLTKSGRTKSCGLRLVSRTRLRSAAERRSRRGRWSSLRMELSVLGTEPRAKSSLPAVPDRRYSFGNGTSGQLLAHRYQQLVYESSVCVARAARRATGQLDRPLSIPLSADR